MTEEYLTDDEQLEAVKRAISEYAPWLIGGAVIGAALFFGYRHYQSSTTERGLKAAAEWSAMSDALQANNRDRSRQIADGIIKDYAESPYADQARLTIARLYVEGGRLDEAIAPLTQVMNDSKDTELRQVARLRLARVLTDQGKADAALKTLADGTPGAFAGPYHEVRGDAYYAKKDVAGALAEYKAAMGAADASGVNAALLELKIQDLGAVAPPPASAASLGVLNKAKP
jgi:predicted negative regulator of RcsB-dependent stress response